MARSLKVLQVFHAPYPVPRGYDFAEEMADPENMYTEKDIYEALKANGYTVRLLGLYDDISLLVEEVNDFQPDVVFNMVEVFRDESQWEHAIAALLELMGVPYTGSSSQTLFLCNNKALAKKILRFHRIRVPRFQAFIRGHKVWRPKVIHLPAVIKPLSEEASRGISQASVVDNDQAFRERVLFLHEQMKTDAIAEEYVDGRELYVTVIGRKRLTVLPPRELKFGQFPAEEPRIATYKAKWDDAYRERWGIKSVYASPLAEGVWEKVQDVCKRAYRALGGDSYIRFDIRVTPGKRVVILEPNANPCLARIDEVAQAAEKVGIRYPDLIRKIVSLARRPGRPSSDRRAIGRSRSSKEAERVSA